MLRLQNIVKYIQGHFQASCEFIPQLHFSEHIHFAILTAAQQHSKSTSNSSITVTTSVILYPFLVTCERIHPLKFTCLSPPPNPNFFLKLAPICT